MSIVSPLISQEGYIDVTNIPNHQLFQTGDILLFSNNEIFPSVLVEDFTHSKYSHVGIILRDPKFPVASYEGLYVLESTGYIDAKDVENHKYQVGVQINELSKVYNVTDGQIYWRRLIASRGDDFNQIFSEVLKITNGKDYDFNLADWIKAYFDWHFGNEQKENEFICSALAAFLYDRLGFLEKPVDWTIVRPVDWGTEFPSKDLRVHTINCQLEPEIQIRFQNPDDPTKPIIQSTSDNNASNNWSYWSYLYAPIDLIRKMITRL